MSARIAGRRLAAGTVAIALAGFGVMGLGASAASAADPDTVPANAYFGGTFYLADSDTVVDLTDQTLGYNSPVVALAGVDDQVNTLNQPSDATGAYTFLSPVGSEYNRTAWNASAPLGLTPPGLWFTDITPLHITNPGTGTPGSAAGVANAGGDYSLGIAYTRANGVQLVDDGVFFIHIHVTANATATNATYTWAPVVEADNTPKATSTQLNVLATGVAWASTAISATVTSTGTPTGTVDFTGTLNGTTISLGDDIAVNGSGVASILASNLTPGTWTINASFTGTGLFESSVAAPKTIEVSAPDVLPDLQTVDVNIPAGTLTITTPYHAENPLHLGDAVFDADSSVFSASADFGSATDIAKAIKIVDRRPGDLGFVASVASSDFVTSGDDPLAERTIPATFAALTDVTAHQVPNNAILASVLQPDLSDVDSFTAGQHDFASYAVGNPVGTAWITGTFSLEDVPSSVLGGLYTATVTFSVG